MNVGEEPTGGGMHSWEDCRRYGFMMGSGGPRYAAQMKRFRAGDRVFAYLSRHGYVGAGIVVSEAVPQKDFVPPGQDQRLIDLPLSAKPDSETLDDSERCGWCVGVRWLAQLDREAAHKLPPRVQTVMPLRDPDLVRQLLLRFGLTDPGLAPTNPEAPTGETA